MIPARAMAGFQTCSPNGMEMVAETTRKRQRGGQ
jgi:hypothetical protein